MNFQGSFELLDFCYGCRCFDCSALRFSSRFDCSALSLYYFDIKIQVLSAASKLCNFASDLTDTVWLHIINTSNTTNFEKENVKKYSKDHVHTEMTIAASCECVGSLNNLLSRKSLL